MGLFGNRKRPREKGRVTHVTHSMTCAGRVTHVAHSMTEQAE